MEEQFKPKSDAEIKAILNQAITDAKQYDKQNGLNYRIKALEYFDGELNDLPAEEGRSSVTSNDTAETIGWVMPSLMRVFLSTDRIVKYEAKKDGDQQGLKEATDYINHIFLRESNGYDVLWDAFHDGLLMRTGVIKSYWDKTPEYEIKTYTDITEEELVQLAQEGDFDVLAKSKDGRQIKIRRLEEKGCIKIEAIPPEDYFISKNAPTVKDADFHAHRRYLSRSDLIEMGYDRNTVKSLPSYQASLTDEEKAERFDNFSTRDQTSDKSRDQIEVWECYIKADFDGDDVAEWNQVIMAGGSDNAREILEQSECDGHCFTVLTPERVPHRWQGRSIFDSTQDVQRIKTALFRQALDNMYLSNTPQKEALDGAVLNPDELINPTLGGVLRVSQIGAIREIATPFVANHAFDAISYCDSIIEKRTGVSRSTMALDPQALNNQSATAANLAHQSSYSKIELIARNYAEQLTPLFARLLKLAAENVDMATYKAGNGFITVNPKSWPTEAEVTIDVGLGTGSRDRDLLMLREIAAQQKEIIGQFGIDNPVCSVNEFVTTLHKMVEAAGGKNPEQFFRLPTPDELAVHQQKQLSKPDPKLQEAQMKLQIEQQKAQGQLQIQASKLQAETTLAEKKMENEIQLRREEMMGEAALKAEALRMGAVNPSLTNIPRQ